MKRRRGTLLLLICLFYLMGVMPVQAASTLKAPAWKTIKSVEAGKIKAEWKKAAGASEYEIQFSVQKNFKTRKTITTTKTSCTASGLTAGTKYYVRIRSYKKSGQGKKYSGWSSLKTVITLPKPPALSSVTSKKAGAVTVTFKKVSGITQYQIQTARNKSFTLGKKTVNTTKSSTTISGLAPEVYYYARVRSVKKMGNKIVYSAWSKVGSVVSMEKKDTYQKKPSVPSGFSVKQDKNGITASWSSVKDAVRYEVKSAADSGFKKNVETAVVYGYEKPSITYTRDMKAGESIYYKVRVYAEDAYGDRNWSNWSSVKRITVKTAYSYKLYLLNLYPIYGLNHAIVYIKTNNPDAMSIILERENIAVYTSNDFKDIDYTGDTVAGSDGYLRPVKGGYVITFGSGQETAQNMKLGISEKLGEDHAISSGVSLNIKTKDWNKGYDDWIDSLISKHTNSSMTFWEKMTAVENYLFNNFKYPSIEDDHYLSLVAETGSIWDTKILDSATSPSALYEVAKKLGCTDAKSLGGYSHATLAVTWKGETRNFTACPFPKKFDPSKVTKIKLP